MALEFVRADITKMKVDAIVNPANSTLLGGGGADGAIHKAAGPLLLEECKALGGCETGQAKITKGYDLPAKYVIHTVGPIWDGGQNNENNLLISCYENSLKLAKDNNLESIAFTMISAGAYGFPIELAMKIAISTITSFLIENDMHVYIVVFDKKAFEIGKKIDPELEEQITDFEIKSSLSNRVTTVRHNFGNIFNRGRAVSELQREFSQSCNEDFAEPEICAVSADKCLSIDDIEIDESAKEMLIRLIDDSGLKTGELCIRANVDRKVISKMRNKATYNPSKPMIIALCIGLKLDLSKTQEVLNKGGYVLSDSSLFDVIVKYYISKGFYDVYEINMTLFNKNQRSLGSTVNKF